MSPSSLKPIPHTVLIRHILQQANPAPPGSYYPLIEKNLGVLLMAQGGSSQVSDGVSFVDFLKLVLRFGFSERIAYSVYEVSTPNIISGSVFDFIGQSESDIGARFASWFIPSSDQNTAKAKIQSGSLKWVVRLAGHPNLFTIQLQYGKSLIATHIKFDAMALRDQETYSVEIDSGVEEKRSHLKDLLREVLNLEIPTYGDNLVENEQPKFVGGSVVASVYRN